MLITFLIYDHFGWSLLIFTLAGISDALDGFIARRFNQKTSLGAILDPVADKLLLMTGFIMLSLRSLDLTTRIPLWLTITTIGRDLLILISCIAIHLATGYKNFPPSILGKITTAVQLLTVLVALVGNYKRETLPSFSFFVYLTLVLTILSGLHYFYVGTRIINNAKYGS